MREFLNPEDCEERATVSAAAIVAQGVRGFESTNGNSGSNRRAQVSTSFRKRRGFVAFFGSGSFLDPSVSGTGFSQSLLAKRGQLKLVL